MHSVYRLAGGSAVLERRETRRRLLGVTGTFIAGIAGVTANNSAPVLINTSTGQVGTLSSSARYKYNIQPMGAYSRGLYQLCPVIFRYTQDAQDEWQYGLIAEEVAKVYPELVTRSTTGEVEAVRYHEVLPMLLNELQHQQRQQTALQAQNARLRTMVEQLQKRDMAQQAQNAALAARLERLEALVAVRRPWPVANGLRLRCDPIGALGVRVPTA